MPLISYQETALPPVDRRAALAYAGARSATDELSCLLDDSFVALQGNLHPRVLYEVFSIKVEGDRVDFGAFSVTSHNLAAHLAPCRRAALFVATLGIEPDRLISRYTPVSLSRATMIDAITIERIEAVCDLFCDDLSKREGACISRFSPGYGDLPLSFQEKIFAVLDCTRHVGVSLNASLLMTPTKSVSAIVGIR